MKDLPEEIARKAQENLCKPTNPKDMAAIGKAPMSYLSGPVLMEMGVGMMEGGLKYGAHNYRHSGVLASIYYDATMRHLISWFEGEDIDPDSGLSHITKAMTSLLVLRDAMIQGKFKDDRPIKTVDPKWLIELSKAAKALTEKYPVDKQVPRFTQLSHGKTEEK